MEIDHDEPSRHKHSSAIVKKFRKSIDGGPAAEMTSKSAYDFYSTESVRSRKFKFSSCFKKRSEMYSKDDLQDSVLRLHKYCLTHLLDSYRVHLNRQKGVKVLNELVRRVYFDDLKISQVVRIIWCGISIVHHFHIRLKVGSGLTEWTRRRQAEAANKTFDRLMHLLLPDLDSTVIHSIITFFEEARLWSTELLCSDLLERVLKISKENTKCMNVLLDVIEQSNPHVAKKILRVVYTLLENHNWEEIDNELMFRFINFYKDSVVPSDEQDYTYFRKSLEVCLRKLFERIGSEKLLIIINELLEWSLANEFENEVLLDFGNVLEYASLLYKTELFDQCFTHSTMTHILLLIQSDNVLKSLLGNRVFQHMLDRHKNKTIFDVPRIFFQNTHFNINLGTYNTEDKDFLRRHRDAIHCSLLISVQNHGIHSRINLESLYCSIAIIIIEIPCGYTAAAMSCLMMAIQETTIASSGIDLECSNRIHAIVMSTMSLICWVHNAEVFYDYLNTILHRRAEFAPHLNPPLQILYQYARHHILWNKPELFFEDWEVRYGLWKCFRSMRATDSNLAILKEKKKEEIVKVSG